MKKPRVRVQRVARTYNYCYGDRLRKLRFSQHDSCSASAVEATPVFVLETHCQNRFGRACSARLRRGKRRYSRPRVFIIRLLGKRVSACV